MHNFEPCGAITHLLESGSRHYSARAPELAIGTTAWAGWSLGPSLAHCTSWCLALALMGYPKPQSTTGFFGRKHGRQARWRGLLLRTSRNYLNTSAIPDCALQSLQLSAPLSTCLR